MRPRIIWINNSGVYECHGDVWARIGDAPADPRRGRIRRALILTAKALIGVAFLYGMIWAASISCVALGHPPSVCGL